MNTAWNPIGAAMNEINEFLKEKTGILLGYLDGIEPDPTDALAPLDLIDSILEEWSRKFGDRRIPPPTLKERTFWFTLYQYEEVVEIPPTMPGTAPYEALLMKNLATAKELLRENRDLPAVFYATRPGEDDLDDMDDDDLTY